MISSASSQSDLRLLAAQLRALAERGRVASWVSIGASLVIAWVHREAVPATQIFMWLGAMCAVQAVRLVWVNPMRVAAQDRLGLMRCLRAQVAVNILTGLAWGAIWFVLDSGAIDFLFVFKCGAIAGASGAAVNSLCVVFPAYMGFMLSQKMLTISYLLSSTPFFLPGQRVAFIAGTVVYLIALAAISRNGAKLAEQAFVQGFERDLSLAEANESHRREHELRKRLQEKSRQYEEANEKLNETNARLQVLARQDALTGVFNRRHLAETLDRNLQTWQRYGMNFSLVIFDIDHFKQINDSYGHHTGDLVLTAVAAKTLAGLREIDVFGRWGGEEFLCILPNTDFDEAMVCAERLCRELATARLLSALPELTVTASFGVVMCGGKDDADTLVSRADIALYQAKTAGRNRVIGARA